MLRVARARAVEISREAEGSRTREVVVAVLKTGLMVTEDMLGGDGMKRSEVGNMLKAEAQCESAGRGCSKLNPALLEWYCQRFVDDGGDESWSIRQ